MNSPNTRIQALSFVTVVEKSVVVAFAGTFSNLLLNLLGILRDINVSEIATHIDININALCVLCIFAQNDKLYRYTLGLLQTPIIRIVTLCCCMVKIPQITLNDNDNNNNNSNNKNSKNEKIMPNQNKTNNKTSNQLAQIIANAKTNKNLECEITMNDEMTMKSIVSTIDCGVEIDPPNDQNQK